MISIYETIFGIALVEGLGAHLKRHKGKYVLGGVAAGLAAPEVIALAQEKMGDYEIGKSAEQIGKRFEKQLKNEAEQYDELGKDPTAQMLGKGLVKGQAKRMIGDARDEMMSQGKANETYWRLKQNRGKIDADIDKSGMNDDDRKEIKAGIDRAEKGLAHYAGSENTRKYSPIRAAINAIRK